MIISYISAFVITVSLAEKAILKVIKVFISKEIVDEVLSVLSKKFDYKKEMLSRTAIFLSEIAELIKTHDKVYILKDEADSRIIECAVLSEADIIVSGGKEMLSLKEYKGIKIITLREFFER